MPTPPNETSPQENTGGCSVHDVTAFIFSAGVTGIAWSTELESTKQTVIETGSITLVAGSVVVSAVSAITHAYRSKHTVD